MNADKGKLTSELSDRLDDLFSEGDDSSDQPPHAAAKDHGGEMGAPASEAGDTARADHKESPLIELDAIVLSLDWEITDENLEKLLTEIERLKKLYKDSRLPYMFLQLHGSVGKYIASKKVDAHPDSIKLLHSVHAGLEKVLINTDISELEKKRILSEEVKKFKGLKHEIMLSKSIGAEEIEEVPVRKTLATVTPEQPPEPADRALNGSDRIYRELKEEIRLLIKEEFKELKEEIMSWKQSQEQSG